MNSAGGVRRNIRLYLLLGPQLRFIYIRRQSLEGGRFAPAVSAPTSLFPQTAAPKAAVKDYLVGAALDEALASGQDVVVSWPFADGDVSDWTQAEAISSGN